MIKFLDKDSLKDFLLLCNQDKMFGIALYTEYQCYGLDHKLCDFWVAYDDDNQAKGCLARMKNAFTLLAKEGLDLVEVAEFLKVVGGYTFVKHNRIYSDVKTIKKLNTMIDGEFYCAPFMLYHGNPFGMTTSNIEQTTDLKRIFNLLTKSYDYFREHTQYNEWYAEMSHKIRHYGGEFYLLTVDNEDVSTGSIHIYNETTAMLSSIATNPDYARQGYASQIVQFLCNRILSQGKTPALYCADYPLEAFYQRLGFVNEGDWGEISKITGVD